MSHHPNSVKPAAPASRRVLVLAGPTASGKTSVSLMIAPRLKAEILSADSRQIYRFMEIGTARPTDADMKSVRHYFVDELSPDQDFNAGNFGKAGRTIIDGLFRRGKTPLIVGGSGLYIRALVDGFFEGPSADPELRKRLYRRITLPGGPEVLLKELRAVDPESASRMLPSNTRRIVRALEVYELTGVPISALQKEKIETGFSPVFVGLMWDRAQLYRRIDDRVDSMIHRGLIGEVRALRRMGYGASLNSLQTTGYQETFQYLDGVISRERMIELIKRNTRRYAKRQLTWFRQDSRIRWFPVGDEGQFPELAQRIVGHFLAGEDRSSRSS